MFRLFSYCIPYDDGAAPNPFWDVCTLAICKPRIRSAAQVGDWVVGTGSSTVNIANAEQSAVYAMRVTNVMSMREYDAYTRTLLLRKIPDWSSNKRECWTGDSIYDFDYDPPRQRPAVHGPAERERDLSGKKVLLSDRFWYFGDKPAPLPAHLLPIVHRGQGHKSNANRPYAVAFVDWIESLGIPPRALLGRPQTWRYRPPERADSESRCGHVRPPHHHVC